ncbi:hypothetical protein QJS66_12820 [Kocuria rhizophila]|nr:hypothetical protein QJS66_12820 [Kocuria rhizophila]
MRFTPEKKREIMDSRVDSTKPAGARMGQVPRSVRVPSWWLPRSATTARAAGRGAHRGLDLRRGIPRRGLPRVERAATALPRTACGWSTCARASCSRPPGACSSRSCRSWEAGLSGCWAAGSSGRSLDRVDDMAGAIAHLALTEDAEAPSNVAAPNPQRQKDFAKTVAGVPHRPAVVPTPPAGPKAVLGTGGTGRSRGRQPPGGRVQAAASAYRFRHEDLRGCAQHLLGRGR